MLDMVGQLSGGGQNTRNWGFLEAIFKDGEWWTGTTIIECSLYVPFFLLSKEYLKRENGNHLFLPALAEERIIILTPLHYHICLLQG